MAEEKVALERRYLNGKSKTGFYLDLFYHVPIPLMVYECASGLSLLFLYPGLCHSNPANSLNEKRQLAGATGLRVKVLCLVFLTS